MILTLILAVLPTIILSYFVYKKDILEKEPIELLFLLFFLGVSSTVPVAVLENIFINIIPNSPDNILNIFVLSFFGIALFEEGCKALITYKVAFKNKNFNHIYDGIVYSVFVSLGFATLENILYVLQYGIKTGIFRALTSVPAHAFFGVSMGYYMGLAKYSNTLDNKVHFKLNIILSIAVPIIFHGIFDFLLLTEIEIMIIIFFVFVIALYILAYKQINKHSKIMTMLK